MDEFRHASGSDNGYDPLNQLTGFVRVARQRRRARHLGQPLAGQDLDFEALGYWQGLSTNGTPEGRNRNAQNLTLTHDTNGNKTTDETGRKVVYDGWNRLVEVENSGSIPLRTATVFLVWARGG